MESYLNERMETEHFTIEDLLRLSVDELAAVPELEGIGKITISSVLADFKRKYEDTFFNEVDDESVADATSPNPIVGAMSKTNSLSQDEVQLLRRLLQERAEKQNAELIELKLALKNAGIDYMMILKDYRTQKELELKEWEDAAKY